jgi:CBS domain-containing protein
MLTVRNILESKVPGVWHVSPDATAYEALELMAEKDIGALLVVDGGQVVGIFSERDYARKVILKGRSSKETTVGEIMSTPVCAITPDRTINECMALMTTRKHRHLPVIENGGLIGFISIGDVVNSIISDQRVLIHDLENFICGGDYTYRPEEAVETPR